MIHDINDEAWCFTRILVIECHWWPLDGMMILFFQSSFPCAEAFEAMEMMYEMESLANFPMHEPAWLLRGCWVFESSDFQVGKTKEISLNTMCLVAWESVCNSWVQISPPWSFHQESAFFFPLETGRFGILWDPLSQHEFILAAYGSWGLKDVFCDKNVYCIWHIYKQIPGCFWMKEWIISKYF